MCELLALSSRQAAPLSLSLAALAAHSAPGHSARDGWGVAYFSGGPDATGAVTVHREAAPANDSALARQLIEASPVTALALAHIRHATQGARTLSNTQPFAREIRGRQHVFAHNGDLHNLGSDSRFALDACRPAGDTDSEHAFCALLQRLAPLWLEGQPSLRARWDVVRRFAAELRALGPANFLYTDGDVLFAHADRRRQDDGSLRPPGLYWLQRQHPLDSAELRVDGVCLGCGYGQALLLASVALSAEPWQALGEGEIVAVRDGAFLLRETAG